MVGFLLSYKKEHNKSTILLKLLFNDINLTRIYYIEDVINFRRKNYVFNDMLNTLSCLSLYISSIFAGVGCLCDASGRFFKSLMLHIYRNQIYLLLGGWED